MTTDLTHDLPSEDLSGKTAPPTEPSRGPSVLTILRFVMPTIVVVGMFAVLTNHAKDPLSNTDTYFHLRFGHEFLHGAWSLGHPGSVTTLGTNDWVPTQWLPQVVMAQTEDWFGLAGVAWLSGLIYLALAFTVWAIARRYASPLAAAPVTVVALLAAGPGMSMRPQVLSYLFIAVTTAAWLRTREDRKARWWLVPLAWVWAMVHGMWPVGIVIGVVAVLGLALDRAVSRREWLRLAAIPVLSAVVTALTPVGPALYGAVLQVNSRGHYFAEWQPPDFRDANCIALLVLLAPVVLRLARRTTPMPWTELLLLGLAVGWALYTNRTVNVAAMMLVPFAAAALQAGLKERYAVSRAELFSVVAGAVACLAVLAVLVPRTADEPPAYPTWLGSLGDLPDGTVVLNDWGEGGYLMWRFPHLDFVMNGYGDIFTDAELERNYTMDATNPGWISDVKGTGARYAVLRPGSRLAYDLVNLEDWQVTHTGRQLELLEAPDGWPGTKRD
jgi:hypothetical protein